MKIEEMLETLIKLENPDARLRRFLEFIHPVKQLDGSYMSIRGRVFEPIRGQRWRMMLKEWIEYARGGDNDGKRDR